MIQLITKVKHRSSPPNNRYKKLAEHPSTFRQFQEYLL